MLCAIVAGAEQFLEQQHVDVGLLAPQHHQHDHLQHIERDRRFIGGKRALDDDLALRRRQLRRLFEKTEKTYRFDSKSLEFGGRVDAKRALAFRDPPRSIRR